MDLQQIKYFLAVVDCGTFLAASKNVHVSQPTLSSGIRKLEESLNVTLFNRGSRAASLTTAGKQFLDPARLSYNQLLAIKAKLTEKPEKITMGVLANIHMDHVAKIVSVHRSTHPHILIEFVVAGNEELSQMLKEQKVDLTVVNSYTKTKNFMPIIAEQLCVAVSKQHPLAMLDTIDLKALSGEPFIERIKCGFWGDVNQILQQKNIQLHTVMQAENDEFVLALVAANLGISIITDRVTPYLVNFIPIKDFAIDRYIGICVSPYAIEPHVQVLYETIMEQYKQGCIDQSYMETRGHP